MVKKAGPIIHYPFYGDLALQAVVSSRSFLLCLISNLARSSRRICGPVPWIFARSTV
jgi:hypothetical protein